MNFRHANGVVAETVIPRLTPCTKPIYTDQIKRMLDDQINRTFMTGPSDDDSVAVLLCGMIRYVWRSDVLTKQQLTAADRAELKQRGDAHRK